MEREFSVHPEDPEGYLRAKLPTENATPQDHLDWFSEAKMPIFENIEPPLETHSGSILLRQKYHGIDFRSSVTQITDTNLEHPKIQKFIAAQQEEQNRKRKGSIGGFAKIERLFVSDSEKKIFSLTDLLPSGHYFLLMNDAIADSFDSCNKVICIHDISSPDGILCLMHEAGHANIYESLDGNERGALNSALSRYRGHRGLESDFAIVLKQERDAWAWALKKLRPILSNNPQEGLISREQLTKFIHKIALQSYGERIAKEMASIEMMGNLLRKISI